MSSIGRSHDVKAEFISLKRKHAVLQERFRKLQAVHTSANSHKNLYRAIDDNIRLKNRQDALLCWMRKMSFGYIPLPVPDSHVEEEVRRELARLYQATASKSRRTRMKALAVIFHIYRINLGLIARFLFIGPRTLKRYFKKFDRDGADGFLTFTGKKVRKADDRDYKEALLSILHSPPADFGINRTTWTTRLLSGVMTSRGWPVSHGTVSDIIKRAGYRFRKAREVLTSNDPQYREKLKNITRAGFINRFGLKAGTYAAGEHWA